MQCVLIPIHPVYLVEQASPTPSEDTTQLPVDLSVFGSVRPYYTQVMYYEPVKMRSNLDVLENTIGMSLASKPLKMGQYITLVPHLDFLMQWANYGEESIKDLLNYRFGMVKGNLDFYLPLDFSKRFHRVLNMVFYTVNLPGINYLMRWLPPFRFKK